MLRFVERRCHQSQQLQHREQQRHRQRQRQSQRHWQRQRQWKSVSCRRQRHRRRKDQRGGHESSSGIRLDPGTCCHQGFRRQKNGPREETDERVYGVGSGSQETTRRSVSSPAQRGTFQDSGQALANALGQRQETVYRGGRSPPRDPQARAPRLQVPAPSSQAKWPFGQRRLALQEPEQRHLQRVQVPEAGGHQSQRRARAKLPPERSQLLSPDHPQSGIVASDSSHHSSWTALRESGKSAAGERHRLPAGLGHRIVGRVAAPAATRSRLQVHRGRRRTADRGGSAERPRLSGRRRLKHSAEPARVQRSGEQRAGSVSSAADATGARGRADHHFVPVDIQQVRRGDRETEQAALLRAADHRDFLGGSDAVGYPEIPRASATPSTHAVHIFFPQSALLSRVHANEPPPRVYVLRAIPTLRTWYRNLAPLHVGKPAASSDRNSPRQIGESAKRTNQVAIKFSRC